MAEKEPDRLSLEIIWTSLPGESRKRRRGDISRWGVDSILGVSLYKLFSTLISPLEEEEDGRKDSPS